MNILSEFFYFGPLLWKTKLSNEIIDGLLERGLISNTSHRHKLVGHFKDEYSYTTDDMNWFVNKSMPYFLEHRKAAEHWYATDMKPVQLTSLWINIMKAGDYNPPHTHDGELSFVIYLKVPEKLKEEFDEYEGRNPTTNGAGAVTFVTTHVKTNNFINSKTFLPEVGDMYIFPAGLPHYVAPFKCEGERISVSGNISARLSDMVYGNITTK